MKHLHLLLGLIVLIVAQTFGQEDFATGWNQTTIRVTPLYQRWTVDDETFSEFSSQLTVGLPLSNDFSMMIQSAQATVSGDVEGVNGITDTKLGLRYAPRSSNVLFHVGVNLPSGKNTLTAGQFETSSLLSSNVFNFQVQNLGQGLNINPGIAFAFPAGSGAVFGVGAGYTIKGAFTPIDGMEEYNPGDELLLTGGLDVSLNARNTATLSADILLSSYGNDRLGETEVLASGKRIIAGISVQQSSQLSRNSFAAAVRYRSKSKSEIAQIGGGFMNQTDKLEPNQFEVGGIYRYRTSSRFVLGFRGQMRIFEETPDFLSGTTVFGGGVNPEVALSDQIKLVGKFMYQRGTLKNDLKLTGIEMGAGLEVKW